MGKKTNKQQKVEPQTEPQANEEEQVTEAQSQDVETAAETPDVSLLEEQLKNEISQAREEAQKNLDLYLRAMADMDNLRKRTQREKEELGKFANENILREILTVVDNLERAVEHAEQSTGDHGLLEGVQMTLTHFSQVLTRFGVEPVISLGLPFNPDVHQAMGQMETDEYPSNTVAQEMQKGYLLNERLLRPALVMIAKAPVAKEPEAADEQSTETDEH